MKTNNEVKHTEGSARSEHTPTPWHLGTNGKSGKGLAICQDIIVIGEVYGTGYPVGTGWSPESQANAEFIVRAVNSHEALLEIAKWVVSGHASCSDIITKAQKAIAQAEGKGE